MEIPTVEGNRLPELVSHVYWLRKEAFQLAYDTYKEWVMFVLEEGAFRYRIGNQEEGRAEPGDIVICPPQQVFARETITPLHFHFISFNSTTALELPSGKIRLSRQSRLADNCARLRAHAQGRNERSVMMITHLLRDLWLMILEESAGSSLRTDHAASPSDPVMTEIRAHLQERAYRTIQLKDVAAHFHLTPVQLTRRFHACFGVNPNEYVTDLRLRRAGELLTETLRTVEDIAGECGYESGFYLSRVFARHMGLSPSRYREKYRV